VLTCTRTTRKFGILPSFKDHFLSPRAKPLRHDSPACAPPWSAWWTGSRREGWLRGEEEKRGLIEGRTAARGSRRWASQRRGCPACAPPWSAWWTGSRREGWLRGEEEKRGLIEGRTAARGSRRWASQRRGCPACAPPWSAWWTGSRRAARGRRRGRRES
jgi:hypothetical protein